MFIHAVKRLLDAPGARALYQGLLVYGDPQPGHDVLTPPTRVVNA